MPRVEPEPAPSEEEEEEEEEPAPLAAVAVGRPALRQETGWPNPESSRRSPPTSSNFHSSGSNVTQARSLERVKMRISPWRAYLQPIAAIAAVGLDWPPSRQSSR